MKSLCGFVKICFFLITALSMLMLFSVISFAAEIPSVDLDGLDQKEFFVLGIIIAALAFLFIIAELIKSVKYRRTMKYPKDEIAELENLLSRAMEDDVIKNKNCAVVLGTEPDTAPISVGREDANNVKKSQPAVTEKILGIDVNQSSKIDLFEEGKSVKERFAIDTTVFDNIKVGEEKIVRPWGTLVEGNEERPLFISIEEHKEGDSLIELDKNGAEIEIEESVSVESELERGVPKSVSSVREGSVTYRRSRELNKSYENYASSETVPTRFTENGTIELSTTKVEKKLSAVTERDVVKRNSPVYEDIDEIHRGKVSTVSDDAVCADAHDALSADDTKTDEELLHKLELTVAQSGISRGDISKGALQKYKEAVSEANNDMARELKALGVKPTSLD